MSEVTNPNTPPATIESLDLHVRSYRSALKSTHEITINSLTNSHLKMDPILHQFGSDPSKVDISAIVYAVLRLPEEIDLIHKVIAAPTPEVFSSVGFKDVNLWPNVTAPARRRKYHFNKSKKLLACFINSISDIDDLTNLLITFQVEWNKLHLLLKENSLSDLVSTEELNSLSNAFGSDFQKRFERIKDHPLDLRIQLLAGSWVDYCKATQKWWKNISKITDGKLHISKRPIYFVSSNAHSLVNLISGFALKEKAGLLKFIKKEKPDLYEIYKSILAGENNLPENDFLYFISRYYLDNHQNHTAKNLLEKKINLTTIPSSKFLDINTQIISLKDIVSSKHLDPRLKIKSPAKLNKSDALIFNIDYPLGFAAYHILSEVLENVREMRGVYVMGKAAVLNSEIGDIQIPRLVYDEHTGNSYIFRNCFNTFFPFVNNQGSILTNQKAVSVLGTYIENEALLKNYSQENLTVIEMESGPYLEAISEATFDHRHTTNETIDLNSAPFDIGIVDYTSDTPYSKARNMGVKTLTLDGVEPTYLASLAILQRIIELEESR
ncbi:MAG: hypothetical protein UW44_C0007G0024 [Candidatus Collierbacteria bacterium GW2011_GWB2_44_22]|uniref:Uncharacterized protein n=1 Tax=Candidatus Collierbacteria bacterium GW2011_GWB2_44_22 TaxID=1618387 RepID=A0A0G1KVB6_9BACT|nr:MAG: hypothetical protein UW31_C0003G0049 [Candidatus Collierbacteria bacterium GW2011_GWA2_44_13]KKT51849.1 MAG: hypothetical protein UW44_C0007G0024 [Candidatus Collierbacteria bacterium GW2011_GWB2_44_22]KKT61136.1 MAG: hypothetical protein UW56_C0032G0003 [Candidatus Collierbacteria bacterium GW2011_GWD1_44_27]